MAHAIFSNTVASITELKRNPMGTVEAGGGEAVAILNRNEPAFYCVPADVYERLMEMVEDVELGRLADEALKRGEMVSVNLDDL